ncbi:MAG: hypothetical protein ACLSGS_01725 [Adlercreutzia sp.]
MEFKQEKIAEAVERAFQACGAMQDRAAAEDIAQRGGQAGVAPSRARPRLRACRTSWRRRSSSPASSRRPSPTSCTAPSAAARAT